METGKNYVGSTYASFVFCVVVGDSSPLYCCQFHCFDWLVPKWDSNWIYTWFFSSLFFPFPSPSLLSNRFPFFVFGAKEEVREGKRREFFKWNGLLRTVEQISVTLTLTCFGDHTEIQRTLTWVQPVTIFIITSARATHLNNRQCR